jgi:hypothetical protein
MTELRVLVLCFSYFTDNSNKLFVKTVKPRNRTQDYLGRQLGAYFGYGMLKVDIGSYLRPA